MPLGAMGALIGGAPLQQALVGGGPSLSLQQHHDTQLQRRQQLALSAGMNQELGSSDNSYQQQVVDQYYNQVHYQQLDYNHNPNITIHSTTTFSNATTTLFTMVNDSWADWNSTYTDATTNALSYNSTWYQWNHGHQQQLGARPVPPQLVTPAEQALAREAERIYRADLELKSARAKERAAALLMSLLTPEQQADIAARGSFKLECNGRVYEIQRCTHGNIYELDRNGNRVRKLCVQPSGVPTDDAVAAQILHLRHDEVNLRMIANHSNPVTGAPLTRVA